MELLERDHALASLRSAFERAAAGRGCGVFLHGEAGLGKTSLLAAAAELAADRWSIVRAAGYASEADLPFAYLEQWATGPGRDSTGLGPLERRTSAQKTAYEYLQTLATDRPVLLLLDDLHWADPDSLDVLAFVARRLSGLPVLMLGALRPWPERAARTVEGLQSERLVLAPLTRVATDTALRRLVDGDVATTLADRAWRLTGGNPQLVGEAARFIGADGALPNPGSTEARGTARRVLLLSHLAGLPLESITCARAASVLGNRFRIGVVEALVDLLAADFAAAFDALTLAGIVRNAGDGTAEFTHELLAHAVYDDIGPAGRRLLHRRAFDCLYGSGDRLSAAGHAVAADLAGDRRAIEILAEAGAAAMARGAVETGLHLMTAAISLAEPTPDDALLARYADALFVAGRAAESIETSERLLAQTDQDEVRATANARIARAFVHLGRLDEAIARYDDLVTSSGDDIPGALLVERAHAAWERDGPAAALETIDSALPGRGPRPDGDLLQPVRALFALEAGDASGLPVIERAAQRSRRRSHASPDDVLASTPPLAIQVAAWGALERYDEALGLIDEGVAWLLGVGGLRAAIPLRTARIGILLQQGRLARVLTEADELYAELDVEPLARTVIEGFRARALAWLGRSADARATVDAVARLPGVHSWYARMNLAMAGGQLLRAEGDLVGAAECYADVFALAQRFGLGEPRSPAWAAGAVETFLDAGLHAEATAVAEWLEATGSFDSAPWSRLVAHAARAGCAAAARSPQQDDIAEAHYAEALALPSHIPLDRAEVQLRYGSWLRRRGRAQQARTPLAEALRTAETCGAAALAIRIGEELRASGGRRRREPASAQTLTVQESRVARMAATGATTPEIAMALVISPRTVETHLARTFAKLGVKDRRELRRRAADLPL